MRGRFGTQDLPLCCQVGYAARGPEELGATRERA